MADQHWDDIYQRKAEAELSGSRQHLEQSLAFVDAAGLAFNDPIIDVGGGTSTFVDDLLARGYTNITVLDLASTALDLVRARLGHMAKHVTWVAADVTVAQLPADYYRFWHDRAVFHFLNELDQRQRYVANVMRSVRSGGHVVVGTFGVEGPTQCSGLPVQRYSSDTLHAEFGAAFEKVAAVTEEHHTPWGRAQQFQYCHCLLRR